MAYSNLPSPATAGGRVTFDVPGTAAGTLSVRLKVAGSTPAGAAATLAVGARDYADIYLIGGQSNAEGGADQTDLDTVSALSVRNLRRSFTRAKMWNYTTNAFEPLLIAGVGVGNNFGYTYPSTPNIFFGAEAAIADIAETTTAGTIYLVKYALGGTNIDSWLTAGANRPRLDQSVHDALAASVAAGKTPRIKGMLWSQGEADQGMASATYQAKLNSLFASLYADYLPATAKIAITLMRPAYDAGGNIRTAQTAYIASNSYAVALVPDASGMEWPARTDVAIHYNGLGQYEQGKAFMLACGFSATAGNPATFIQETNRNFRFAPLFTGEEAVGKWRQISVGVDNGGRHIYMDPGNAGTAGIDVPACTAIDVYASTQSTGPIKFDVTVDGVAHGTVDVPPGTNSTSVVRLTIRGLANTPHTVQYVAVASYNAFCVVDALATNGAAPVETTPGTFTRIENTATAWAYIPTDVGVERVGAWRNYVTSAASGGSCYYVDAGQSGTATYALPACSEINLVFPGIGGAASVAVYLDGAYIRDVDLPGGTTPAAVLCAFRYLPLATHTLEIRAVASYGRAGCVDAIEYR